MRSRILRGIVVAAALSSAAVMTPTVAQAAPSAIAIRDCIDVSNRDVGYGDRGDYVREVQCLLNWAINPGTHGRIAVDGHFGPATRDKVIRFQQCANARGANIAVDGRVGRQTAPHLEWWAQHSQYIC